MMNFIYWRVTILLFLAGACVSYADKKDDEIIPIYCLCVKELEKAPIIDGKLDDECWKNATFIEDFGMLASDSSKRPPETIIKIGYTDKTIFLAAECFEPDIKALKAHIYNKNIAIYWRDCLEFYFDPEGRKKKSLKFMVNPIEEIHPQARWDKGWGFFYDEDWGSGSESIVKANILKDRWTLELAVPLSELNLKIEDGNVIGFNVNRFILASEANRGFYTWAARGKRAKNNDPRYFGHILFSNKLKTPEELIAMIYPDYKTRILAMPLQNELITSNKGKIKKTSTESIRKECLEFINKNADMLKVLNLKDPDSAKLINKYKRYLRKMDNIKKKINLMTEKNGATAFEIFKTLSSLKNEKKKLIEESSLLSEIKKLNP